MSPHVRQHRDRRRPQRPGVRDLPGARRQARAGARSGGPAGRRGDDARIRAGIQGVGMRAPAAPDARHAARELRLSEHGLKLAAESLPTVALAENAQHLHLGSGDLSGLAQRVPQTPRHCVAWRALLQRFARALHPLLTQTPPRLGTDAWRDRAALLGLGWRIRRLGRSDMRELLRIGGMYVHDLLEDRFSLRAAQGRAGAGCRAWAPTMARVHRGPCSRSCTAAAASRRRRCPGAAARRPGGAVGRARRRCACRRAPSCARRRRWSASSCARISVAGVTLASGEEITAASRRLERRSQDAPSSSCSVRSIWTPASCGA